MYFNKGRKRCLNQGSKRKHLNKGSTNCISEVSKKVLNRRSKKVP